MSLNTITVMGRLPRDVEKKTTPSGVPVANFTLAVDRDHKNGDEKVTDWIDCVAWRGTADFLEKYGTKGRMVVVNGSLQSRKWTDRDGNNRTSFEVQAQNVYFADSKRDSAPSDTGGGFKDMDDDTDAQLPF